MATHQGCFGKIAELEAHIKSIETKNDDARLAMAKEFSKIIVKYRKHIKVLESHLPKKVSADKIRLKIWKRVNK